MAPQTYSESVRELLIYLSGLKDEKDSFDWRISGEEAAKQLGFTRLFASTYEELVLHSKLRMTAQGSLGIAQVIADYESIVQEELQIDSLQGNRDPKTVTTIAFLRALQNGDAVFPGPQPLAPTSTVVLMQLSTAYPEFKPEYNDPFFSNVYREVREFAAVQFVKSGEISAPEVIAAFRHQILQDRSTGPSSANAPIRN